MSSDPLFRFYERARAKIRRHDPESMLEHAVGILHQVQLKGIEAMKRYQPWNVLLAMKWILQEAYPLAHRRPKATLEDLHAVLRIVYDIDGHVRMPDEYDHVNLFMRHLAFQQFWLQQGGSGEALVRQDLMFSALPPTHPLAFEFLRITGVPPREFMELAFALFSQVLKQPAPVVIHRHSFNSLHAGLAPVAVDAFLRHLSKSVPELHDWLCREPYWGLAIADQKILPSPLVDVPLIRSKSGDYVISYGTLVMRSLESVLYRTLRRDDPAQFGVRFGPVFEAYMARCFADAGVAFLDEAQLEARLPGEGKCADFLVTEPDCNVFFDAKGIEMSALGRVSQKAELVLRAIKESALKAVEQGMATAHRLRAAPPESGLPPGDREAFLIVVTFDDLYLGSNYEFENIFGAHLLPKLERRFGSSLPIALRNVFFLTVDELERLLVRVQSKTGSIGGILRHARAHDSERSTQKFNFQQHLDSFSTQTTRLPMLQAGLEDLVRRCVSRLPPEMQKPRGVIGA